MPNEPGWREGTRRARGFQQQQSERARRPPPPRRTPHPPRVPSPPPTPPRVPSPPPPPPPPTDSTARTAVAPVAGDSDVPASADDEPPPARMNEMMLIWSPTSSVGNNQADNWAIEVVSARTVKESKVNSTRDDDQVIKNDSNYSYGLAQALTDKIEEESQVFGEVLRIKQVFQNSEHEGSHSDFSGPTGSTACVVVIRNNQLVGANAGDFRCVISRMDQAYTLSKDHKPDLELEKGRILKAGGFIHEGRVNGSLNLARTIGDMEFKQNKFLPAEKQIVTASPDINTVELCDDDGFMVFACDSIWDCMSSQQVVDFVHEQLSLGSKPSVVVDSVLDKCLAPSTVGCDNMTMITEEIVSVESVDKQQESSTVGAPPPKTDARLTESESNLGTSAFLNH